MMNKKVVTIGCLSLAILMGGTTFTSCSNNDDEPSVVFPIDKDLAGNYLGDLKVTVSGKLEDKPSTKITISKGATENTITLNLNKFTILSFTGDISLANLALADAGDGTYTFSGNTNVNFVNFKNLPVEVKNGKIGNGKVSVDLVIAAPVVGDVTVNYAGNKLTGSESSEAKILTFTFDPAVKAANASVDSTVIDETNKTITIFTAPDAISDSLKVLKPTLTISENTTIESPDTSAVQDFSTEKTYTLVAQNGDKVNYTVKFGGDNISFNFDNWVAGVEEQEPDMTFYEPQGWCSSNAGAHLLKAFKYASSYVVTEDKTDAHSGSAVKIQTIDSKGGDMIIAKVPKVTTGTLFFGKFITEMGNTLNSTKFGIPYKYTDKYPVQLKGYYKYQAGKDYYTCKAPYLSNCHLATVDASQKDKGNISVVLYETPAYDTENWSDCLTGAEGDNNIKTSSRIVAYGTMDVEDKSAWTAFTLDIKFKDGKSFDATKKYRIAINCSSSYQGDKFWGAPGSTLWVDDFELIYKSVN